MIKQINYSLYLVTNREILKNKTLYEAVEDAILGGVTIVQLREKNLSYKEFLKIAKELKKLTDKYNIPLIINDNIQIAKEIDASGVHLGQSDENIEKAKKILGKNKLIGISVGNEKEAREAISLGADYLGIGTIFYTKTKKDIKTPIGIEGLKKVVTNITIPCVAIGGINKKNIKEIMQSGVDGVAIISDILEKDDIKKASEELINCIRKKD